MVHFVRSLAVTCPLMSFMSVWRFHPHLCQFCVFLSWAYFTWRCRLFFHLKFLPHTVHGNFPLQPCTLRLCTDNVFFLTNALPHIGHTNSCPSSSCKCWVMCWVMLPRLFLREEPQMPHVARRRSSTYQHQKSDDPHGKMVWIFVGKPERIPETANMLANRSQLGLNSWSL